MKCAGADCHFVEARDADEEDKADEGEDMDHCASSRIGTWQACVCSTSRNPRVGTNNLLQVYHGTICKEE
jgi:hypothetical protein